MAAGLDPLGAREMGEDGLLEGTRGLPGRLKHGWVAEVPKSLITSSLN